jgi:hypothetical protein
MVNLTWSIGETPRFTSGTYYLFFSRSDYSLSFTFLQGGIVVHECELLVASDYRTSILKEGAV